MCVLSRHSNLECMKVFKFLYLRIIARNDQQSNFTGAWVLSWDCDKIRSIGITSVPINFCYKHTITRDNCLLCGRPIACTVNRVCILLQLQTHHNVITQLTKSQEYVQHDNLIGRIHFLWAYLRRVCFPQSNLHFVTARHHWNATSTHGN